MTTISLNNNVVTTINTFTVEPQHQQRALELLIEIARQFRKTVPGFISANFHRSADGTRVVNYAQFANEEAVQAVGAKVIGDQENPLLAELREIATPDSRVYELCAILEG
jgi:quinol monooxygenase YgiN